MTGHATIELSLLDEQRFGIRTAKMVATNLEDVAAAKRFADAESVELLIIRIGAAHTDAIHALEKAGGLLMDTLAYWEGPAATHSPPLKAGAEIGTASEAAAEGIKRLAAAAFQAYPSHYKADKRLKPEDADAIYPDWAYRSCMSKAVANCVFVARNGSELSGFCTVKFVGDGRADIPLMAVGPQYRGQGLFDALLSTARVYAAREHAQVIRYSTQITNLSAQRSLSASGLRPAGFQHTFHLWSA